MNKRLWVLNPLLLATALPAWAADDNMIVSANRTHRTVAEMAQTTRSLKAEIEQQVQGGKEFKDVLAQLILASTSAARTHQLRHEHARPRDRRPDRWRSP